MNVVDVLVAEFRETIKLAIPQIIALLSDRELDVCRAGVDALLIFSEQGKVSKISSLNVVDVLVAEFRESIKPAIPRIIVLLSDKELDVRKAAVDALLKFSEQGKVSNFLA